MHSRWFTNRQSGEVERTGPQGTDRHTELTASPDWRKATPQEIADARNAAVTKRYDSLDDILQKFAAEIGGGR